ncbi:hypothetical protein JOM56_012544 [Amanita muscaria]
MIAPRTELDGWIMYYWHLGFPDTKIADHALDHFDRAAYGLRLKSVQRIRKDLNLKGTIQQAATFDTVIEIYKVLRGRFPTMGAHRMVTVVQQEYSIRVSEKLVNDFLRHVEPEAVEKRKRGRFKRRRFWSAGVMEYWSIDQHDKWGRFGLWLHLGIDPYPGRFVWLKVWWCNRNPRLLINYYLEAARKVGGIPLLTMSDAGRENNGIANMHTLMRHQLDPSLHDTLQHRFCTDKKNIKSEIGWSQFRTQWAPGFEDLFDFGVNNGLYCPSDALENLVFRWLAIPWLQAEIDKWTIMYNSSPRRANKYKTLPHGIPDLIHAKPERYDSQNFQIMISAEMFDEMQQEWAPYDDLVFRLTPTSFHNQANNHYASLGRPAISKGTFWDIYKALLACFQHDPINTYATLEEEFNLANLGADQGMDLLPGLRQLRVGDEVVGDGVVLHGDNDEADFTDSEDEEPEHAYAAEFTDNEAE